MSYTEDELSGLTDEERAALEEAGEDDTTTTMAESLEGDGDDASGEDTTGKGDADADDAAGKANDDDQGDGTAGDGGAGAGADADAGTEQPNQAAATIDAGKPAPLLVAEAPADAEARLAAIGQQKSDLIAKFDDGDITAKEYQTSLDQLAKEERGIERAVDKARLASEMRQQQEVNNWMGQVEKFTSTEHPEYGTSKVRWMALDAFVKEIGSDPANAGLSGPQILAQAHQRVVDDLGESAAKPKADGKQPPLKGSKALPPKTLAAVPAAESNTMEDGRWAALDRLQANDPMAHEDKLMKLSEAERDEYLSR